MSAETESTVRRLLDAFAANDLDGLRGLLADDLRAYVTEPDGGVREVGADAYADAVRAMDVPTANLSLEVTQIVSLDDERVMAMVEVHAARGGRTLHNFATHLLTVRSGLVAEWWMVEALPAESDAFWS